MEGMTSNDLVTRPREVSTPVLIVTTLKPYSGQQYTVQGLGSRPTFMKEWRVDAHSAMSVQTLTGGHLKCLA